MRRYLLFVFPVVLILILLSSLYGCDFFDTQALSSQVSRAPLDQQRFQAIYSSILEESASEPRHRVATSRAAWGNWKEAAIGQRGFKCQPSIASDAEHPWALISMDSYSSRALSTRNVSGFEPVTQWFLSQGWHVALLNTGEAESDNGAAAACAASSGHCIVVDTALVDALPFASAVHLDGPAAPLLSAVSLRNAAALLAVACGATVILEASACVLVHTNTSTPPGQLLQPPVPSWNPEVDRGSLAGDGPVRVAASDDVSLSRGFVHVLAHFGHPRLFARGTPASLAENMTYTPIDSRAPMSDAAPPWVHAHVPLGTPDVTAAVRVLRRGSFPTSHVLPGRRTVLLNRGSFAPYGGVATLYRREAFWALLLPLPTRGSAHWQSRHAEAVRSIWAQAVLQRAGATVAFSDRSFYRAFAPPTSAELAAEAAAEADVETAAAALQPALRAGGGVGVPPPPLEDVGAAMLDAARKLVAAGSWTVLDVAALENWMADLTAVGYALPPAVQRDASAAAPLFAPINIRRAAGPFNTAVRARVRGAVCVTGQVDVSNEGYAQSLPFYRKYFPGDNLHSFVFASTFIASTLDFAVLLSLPATRLVIYTDRQLEMKPYKARVADELTDNFVQKDNDHMPRLRQQYWGMNVCYSAVRDWAAHHGIQYELLVRSRTDTCVIKTRRGTADCLCVSLHPPSASLCLRVFKHKATFPPPLPAGYASNVIAISDQDHNGGEGVWFHLILGEAWLFLNVFIPVL